MFEQYLLENSIPAALAGAQRAHPARFGRLLAGGAVRRAAAAHAVALARHRQRTGACAQGLDRAELFTRARLLGMTRDHNRRGGQWRC